MTHDTDEQMTMAIQQLKGLRASPGFTSRVLAGLERRKATSRRRRRVAAGSAIVAVIAVAVTVQTLRTPAPTSAAALAAEARQLRQEHEQLQQELQALDASVRDAAPVLYLGGDDDFDVVLDLAPLIGQSAPATATAAGDTNDPYEL